MIQVRPPRSIAKLLVFAWVFFFALVFVLGIGFMLRAWTPYFDCARPAISDGQRLFSSAYRAAELFTLVAQAPPSAGDCSASAASATSFASSDWPLAVLAVLAPILTLSGLIGLVGKGVGRFLLWVRTLSGDLLIVCGTGDRGLALLSDPNRARRPIDSEEGRSQRVRGTLRRVLRPPVAIVLNDSGAERLNDQSAFLVIGDATQQSVLKTAGVGRPLLFNRETSLIVATQDVRISEEIAQGARTLLSPPQTRRSGKRTLVAYNCQTKRLKLSEILAEPLGQAGPFPVDLALRQARNAAGKALARCDSTAERRVLVIGDTDPVIAADLTLELLRGTADHPPIVSLAMRAGTHDLARRQLELAEEYRSNPIEVDVRAATRSGDSKAYERLTAEILAAGIAVVATGDDLLACDVIEMVGRDRSLKEVKLVVCLAEPSLSVDRLLESGLGLTDRVEPVILSKIADADKIREGIKELRGLLASAFEPVEGDDDGVELAYGAGASTEPTLAKFVAALTGDNDLVSNLQELNWSIAGLHGEANWKKVALNLTSSDDEDGAFLAWCEWLGFVADDPELSDLELIDKALNEVATAGESEAARTVTALLTLAHTVRSPDSLENSDEGVALITGACGTGHEAKLRALVEPAVSPGFKLNEGELAGLEKRLTAAAAASTDERTKELEAIFGAKAGFSEVFDAQPFDPARVVIASPDKAFQTISTQQRGPSSGSTRLQQLVECWQEALRPSGFDPKRSSAVAIYLSNGSPDSAAFEAALARSLGFSRVAVVSDKPSSPAGLPDPRTIVSLPIDRMTIRSFLNWQAPEQSESGPLAASQPSNDSVIIESTAKALQDNYIEMNSYLGLGKPDDDPAMQDWENLIGFFRESTLSSARDWANKKSALEDDLLTGLREWAGGDPFTPFNLSTRSGGTPARSSAELSLDDLKYLVALELLAEMEHGRWNCERIMSGWSSGERDVGKKLTDKVRPWRDHKALRGYDGEYRDLDRRNILCCLSEKERGDNE